MKLAKLPERKRVRLIVQISPDLHERLKSYANLYEKSYGSVEEIEALVPFMIEGFLDEDKAFQKSAQNHTTKSAGRATRNSANSHPENPA
jgi:hypothetical protein